MNYCTCKQPEVEEMKRGAFGCIDCGKEINPGTMMVDAQEPSEGDFSEATNIVDIDYMNDRYEDYLNSFGN